MTSMLDIEPIKARLAAATPGPWGPAHVQKDGMIVGWPERFVSIGRYEVSMRGGRSRVDDDAELIANAPADLAALIAEVERLRAAQAAVAEWDAERARAAALADV